MENFVQYLHSVTECMVPRMAHWSMHGALWWSIDSIIIFNLRTAAFKAYCAIWVRRSNFRYQASPRVSPRESSRRRNCGREMSGNFA